MKNFSVKKISIIALGVLLSSASLGQAYGDTYKRNGPLIQKSNSPGFTFVDAVRSETCEVYLNRVVITKRYGGDAEKSFTTKEVVKFKASTGLLNVIEAAAQEELTTNPNYLCDAPSTNITASLQGEQFTLFNSGGCGGNHEKRDGFMSQMLVDLVDQYCPTTHDFGSTPIFEPALLPADE